MSADVVDGDPEIWRYTPREEPWSGPQHQRRELPGQEAHLSVAFFWTVGGEPTLRREPPGSFPPASNYLPRHSVDVIMPPVDADATVVALSYAGDPPTFPHEGPTYELAVDEGRAVRCVVCRWVSFHRDDIGHGWCANCQKFTGVPFPLDEPGYSLGGTTREHLREAGYNYVREDA